MTQSNRIAMLDVVDAAVCLDVCREIYAQRHLWRGWSLNGQPTFYTLGAASYLELGFAHRPTEEYLGAAGFLWEWAGDVVQTTVEKVRQVLEIHLGARVEYPAGLPAPGFHIFIGAAIPKTDCTRERAGCGSSHFDMQYQHIPWNRWYTHIDSENTVSFTMALKLPAAGAGLLVWESLTVERMREQSTNLQTSDIPSAANVTPCLMIPYRMGSMVVHNGHVLHQIAGVQQASVKDERITLQGHGIFADGAWRLYW